MVTIDESGFVAPGVQLAGDVEVGADCGIWYNAVVRGDAEAIWIGDATNVQDGCVIHVSPGHPCTLGSGVTVGHLAVVHGCTVEDDCLIGMGSIVMNGAIIGEGSVIGAGSLVTEGTRIPPHSVAFGRPCRVVRTATEADLEANHRTAAHYVDLARIAREGQA